MNCSHNCSDGCNCEPNYSLVGVYPTDKSAITELAYWKMRQNVNLDAERKVRFMGDFEYTSLTWYLEIDERMDKLYAKIHREGQTQENADEMMRINAEFKLYKQWASKKVETFKALGIDRYRSM